MFSLRIISSVASFIGVFALHVMVSSPQASLAQFSEEKVEIDSDGFVRIVIEEEKYGYFLSSAKWQSLEIRVCWEKMAVEYSAQRKLVQSAVKDTWERHSKLSFLGWEGCPSKNFVGIRVGTSNKIPHVKRLGSKISGKRNGMMLNFAFDRDEFEACRSTQNLYDLCVRAIAVHEFGHAIGLAHEHNRTDKNQSCMQRRSGKKGDIHLTPYDPSSVMNYCNPNFNNYGVLSELDIKTVQSIYGVPD